VELVAAGEACSKDCRRRGRSSISLPNVLGMRCRLGMRLLEHKEVASSVAIVVLEKMRKVRDPR
jgi:hypothetical protein